VSATVLALLGSVVADMRSHIANECGVGRLSKAMTDVRMIAKTLLSALSIAVACAACASSQPEAAPAVRAAGSDGATDERVDVRLGPHLLAFAASYLRFGMAPDNDTTIELVMTMPDLAPLQREPPMGSLEGAEKVEVWVHALDEASMRRVFSDWMDLKDSDAKPDPLSGEQPRIKGDTVSGLVPFYLDLAALRRQAEARGEKPDTVASPHRVYNRDWYLAYAADGMPASFIECTPTALQDGLEQADGRLRRRDAGNTDVVADCNHKFAIGDLNASVSVAYARAFLPEWRRIEDSVRRTIEQARIRSSTREVVVACRLYSAHNVADGGRELLSTSPLNSRLTTAATAQYAL
jgi:hypothetical protein